MLDDGGPQSLGEWLRDGIGVISDASQTEQLAAALPDDHGVYMVPAFVGLGAPYWQPDARATISGLTLDTGAAHLARAALEAVAYQTLDVFQAMSSNGGSSLRTLKVDGGMSANGRLCQFLADIVGVPVERPRNLESTALGAGFLAGLACGVWTGLDTLPTSETKFDRFNPGMRSDLRGRLVENWKRAVERSSERRSASQVIQARQKGPKKFKKLPCRGHGCGRSWRLFRLRPRPEC